MDTSTAKRFRVGRYSGAGLLFVALGIAGACAHNPRVTPPRVVVAELKAAIAACDVAYFQPWMTPAARAGFGDVAHLGRAMLQGVETLKGQVETRFGVRPQVEPDGTVIFQGAVQVGDERADARINLGFSIDHECSLLGIYGEEVLLREPEVSGPCEAVTLPHSSVRIARGAEGCEIDLAGSPEEAEGGRDVLQLFVTFLEAQSALLAQHGDLSYVDWGGQFMGSFKATVSLVQERLNPPVQGAEEE